MAVDTSSVADDVRVDMLRPVLAVALAALGATSTSKAESAHFS